MPRARRGTCIIVATKIDSEPVGRCRSTALFTQKPFVGAQTKDFSRVAQSVSLFPGTCRGYTSCRVALPFAIAEDAQLTADESPDGAASVWTVRRQAFMSIDPVRWLVSAGQVAGRTRSVRYSKPCVRSVAHGASSLITLFCGWSCPLPTYLLHRNPLAPLPLCIFY